jgi:hypothetical protein
MINVMPPEKVVISPEGNAISAAWDIDDRPRKRENMYRAIHLDEEEEERIVGSARLQLSFHHWGNSRFMTVSTNLEIDLTRRTCGKTNQQQDL